MSHPAEPQIERNVVFGMVSGLALLLDVHHPEKPNGLGVLFITGCGWHAPLTYDAEGLKENRPQVSIWVTPLVKAGYTVFSLNHRAAPKFHYPAAVEDIRRAVRFVRHHAGRFGVDPSRLGGLGGSSGGHLMGLTAMLGAPGIADDPDPVNREPASLQCVVLRAPPCDLMKMAGSTGYPFVVSFMEILPQDYPHNRKIYAEASPITHVSPAAPPTLLLHGDKDATVPFQQSLDMEAALKAAGVPVKLVVIPGGEHGPGFETVAQSRPDWPDYTGEAIRWFDRYLS